MTSGITRITIDANADSAFEDVLAFTRLLDLH